LFSAARDSSRINGESINKSSTAMQRVRMQVRVFHVLCRSLVLIFIAACIAAVPCAFAQGGDDVPTIRVETREVIIPTSVTAWIPERSYCPWAPASGPCGIRLLAGYDAVTHLAASDFHLFEDGKEQTITSAAVARPYSTPHQRDSLGYQQGAAATPNGEWKNLHSWPIFVGDSLGSPVYSIAYKPPNSPDGSCHNIRITVDPKGPSGNRLTTAEFSGDSFGDIVFPSKVEKVKRSKLLLRYRTQYCNVAHASSDPLYGTPINKKLETLTTEDKTEKGDFVLSAFDLFDESEKSRIHVTLDFPDLSNRSDLPNESDLPDRSDLSELSNKSDLLRIPVALTGEFIRADGTLAARFSDATSGIERCHFPEHESAPGARLPCNRENFDNHYETEADLPPGDYSLRVAIDFGGVLRRAEVPVHVGVANHRLAVSGIALCRRYFKHDPIQSGPQLPADGIPTMPLELKPLVSKGIEFTPTGDTHFKANDPLAVYFEVFEPLLEDAQLQPGGGNVQVKFEMRVVNAKTGEVKSDSGFRPAGEFVNPGSSVIPVSQNITIGGLAPGEYQIQVRATDSTGAATDWRATTFTRE